jgi:hypothetical protein
METYIARLEQEDQKRQHPYILATGHEEEVRANLGLPETGLYAGDRLMAASQHHAGIQSEYIYISLGISVATIHIEDGRLKSANVVYKGLPKLWLVVSPGSAHLLERKLQQEYGMTGCCSQFARHGSFVVHSSVLRKWGVRFEVFRQIMGQMVLIQEGAYHFVINEGPNLAGALNYCAMDYDIHLHYRCCTRSCKNGEIPITINSFHFEDKPNPLNIDISFEQPFKEDKKEKTAGNKRQRSESGSKSKTQKKAIKKKEKTVKVWQSILLAGSSTNTL